MQVWIEWYGICYERKIITVITSMKGFIYCSLIDWGIPYMSVGQRPLIVQQKIQEKEVLMWNELKCDFCQKEKVKDE
jgi:hypothetical protein